MYPGINLDNHLSGFSIYEGKIEIILRIQMYALNIFNVAKLNIFGVFAALGM